MLELLKKMLSDAVIAFVGTLVGSGVTLLGVYLNDKLTAKREEKRARVKQEDETISEVFSPLVFIMERTRDLFSRIFALKQTFEKLPEAAKQEKVIFLLKYFTVSGVESYPQTLEKLLVQKSGFIRSQQLYLDLIILQNYLSTLVSFMFSVLTSKQGSDEISKSLESFSPLVHELDEAISQIRQYSIAKICRNRGYEYKQFFTESKYQELENLLDCLSVAITGETIINWKDAIKQLGKDGDKA
jgi:hypothetical protein